MFRAKVGATHLGYNTQLGARFARALVIITCAADAAAAPGSVYGYVAHANPLKCGGG